MKITNYCDSSIMRIEFDYYIPHNRSVVRTKLQWKIVDNIFFVIWERFHEMY